MYIGRGKKMRTTLKPTYWIEAIVDYDAIDLFYQSKEEMLADIEFYKSNPDCLEIAWGEVGRGNCWRNVWHRYPEAK